MISVFASHDISICIILLQISANLRNQSFPMNSSTEEDNDDERKIRAKAVSGRGRGALSASLASQGNVSKARASSRCIMDPDQPLWHKRVEDYSLHKRDSSYIAENFDYDEIRKIKKFRKAEAAVKRFCENHQFSYDGPNDFESDYKRRQRLTCRIKYHLKKGNL